MVITLFPSEEFAKYMTYVKKLGFDEKPDYKYLKRLFKDLFFNKFDDWDFMFDWVGSLMESSFQPYI